MDIREDDLTHPAVVALLRDHVRRAGEASPACAVHAHDVERLKGPDITFWTVWEGEGLMGCGALKSLGTSHCEIKSMRTADAFLRRGVGAAVLEHILSEARSRGFSQISLETGNNEPFAAARALYRRFGFEDCPPFGDYVDDGFSMCMTRKL